MASQSIVDDHASGSAALWNRMLALISSAALTAAANMNIADIIDNLSHPATVEEIAANMIPTISDGNTDRLRRFLRFLARDGFLQLSVNNKTCYYSLTPLSILFTTAAGRIDARAQAQFLLIPALLETWEALPDYIQHGDSAFIHKHKTHVFDYFSRNPDQAKVFKEAGDSVSRITVPLILRKCQSVFEGLNSLVDVGGGTGIVARAIAEEFPGMRCVVLDLPHVVANALPEEERRVTNYNVEYVGGDMFDHVPQADAALVMNVLRNWSDVDCVKILDGCKNAINREAGGLGKVIVVDWVIDEEDEEENWNGYAMELFDMAFSGNKERTLEEWKRLFKDAGFTDLKFTKLHTAQFLIEIKVV